MQSIILDSPFDAHMHWRNKNTLMQQVYYYSVNQFAGGLLMSNTSPYIISLNILKAYRQEVEETLLMQDKSFLPIFTYYLSEELTAQDLIYAWNEKMINAVKYYPKGGTTGSDKGLAGFEKVNHLLEIMQRLKIPLLIHGETPVMNDTVVDDYERERIFMETELLALVERFPDLRICLEHITTAASVEFVLKHQNVIATITPQHCLVDRRALFNGVKFVDGKIKFDTTENGMMPKYMCRPILKQESDLRAIQRGLLLQSKEGLKKFGLGTDTAPHTRDKKYCECGACGVFSAPVALQMYASAFEEIGILDHLQVFAGEIMPNFYGIKDKLPRRTTTLVKEETKVDPFYSGIVTPFAGQMIPWSVK